MTVSVVRLLPAWATPGTVTILTGSDASDVRREAMSVAASVTSGVGRWSSGCMAGGVADGHVLLWGGPDALPEWVMGGALDEAGIDSDRVVVATGCLCALGEVLALCDAVGRGVTLMVVDSAILTHDACTHEQVIDHMIEETVRRGICTLAIAPSECGGDHERG